ncbi:MAG: bifunctional lysylphosphatidylglycerol flippase/synthetase MprF [Solirubrobacteraceae bacterium]
MAALAVQAVVFGLAVPRAHDVVRSAATADERLAILALGAALLALAPRLLRGARIATLLAIAGLTALTALNAGEARWLPAAVQGGLAALLAIWSLSRPTAHVSGHSSRDALAARAIVEAHGTDSLSPFLVRPDKSLAFAAGGVLAYTVIGGTAVVSSDPCAPPGAAGATLAAFRDHAREKGWRVVVWGASARHLDSYRALGMHAVRAGEEAFVDPWKFTLEGRAVRKLRQSVHRAQKRGWTVETLQGREVDAALEAEIDGVQARWREAHPRILGFAMSMGAYDSDLRADDLLSLARSPEGELRAVMRFARCRGLLSLDTMHRVGETPNGLNEALVVAAIEAARELGVNEVSLNYAGLSHLLRPDASRGRVGRLAARAITGPLHRRFQMDRLVRFNEKFSPEWRPRYLVCQSRGSLPAAIVRVLQAEGHLPAAGAGRRSPRRDGQINGMRPLPSQRPREAAGEQR